MSRLLIKESSLTRKVNRQEGGNERFNQVQKDLFTIIRNLVEV